MFYRPNLVSSYSFLRFALDSDVIIAHNSKTAVLLLIAAPIVGFCVCFMFCCALLCVLSSFAIILMGKEERAGCFSLLCLSSWCLVIVIVLWRFFTVPWDCLQCLIMVIPDHTV